VIDKEPLRITELEHVLIEKVEQLFRDKKATGLKQISLGIAYGLR
jgi:hypothetical protein